MGLTELESVTSCVSSRRSNQLSYKPLLCNRRSQTAFSPAELHPFRGGNLSISNRVEGFLDRWAHLYDQVHLGHVQQMEHAVRCAGCAPG